MQKIAIRTIIKADSFRLYTIVRFYYSRGPSKHYDPSLRRRRADSIIKMDLPDYGKQVKQRSFDFASRREFLKKEGLPQDTSFNYMPINISSTGEVMDRFDPPENDGRSSSIVKEGILNRNFSLLKAKGSNIRYIRKIREFDESFEESYFCALAKDRYIDAHKALIDRDADRLHDLITEMCYVRMVSSIEQKSINWKWVRSLEAPRAVQIRTGEMMNKQMVFGQVTMRFFYKQILAIYDRFGRLIHGDANEERDSLEYVTFERMLSNPYSTWRVHEKMCPRWMREASDNWHLRTFVCPDQLKEYDEDDKPDVASDDETLRVSPVDDQPNERAVV